MKFLDLPLLLGRVRFGLAREYPGHALERLALPGIDYRLMHAVLRHQFGDRRLTPYGLEGHLRLELGAVVLPFASHAVRPRHRWWQA